jgi:hypothetical protein
MVIDDAIALENLRADRIGIHCGCAAVACQRR